MKNTNHHPVSTIPKSNCIFIETEAKSIPLAHIYMNAQLAGLIQVVRKVTGLNSDGRFKAKLHNKMGDFNFPYYEYSRTCLNQTPLGLHKLFSLDRCLAYTGSNYIDI